MVKVVTYMSTLMKLAYELGQARLSGDKERIKKAQEAHDNYRDVVLASDEIILGRREDVT